MELKYFKHLIIFLIATIVISLILLILNLGQIVLLIGLMVLFTMASFSYFISLKDVAKDLGRTFSINISKFIPLIIFLAISVPIAIIMFIIEASSLLQAIGLVATLIFVSIVYFWGIKIEINQVK